MELVRARLKSDRAASRRICEQAIADDPGDPEPYDWLARTCLEEGRIEEACALLLRVIEIDPTRTDTYNSLGYFLADCNLAEPPATDDVMRELAFVYLEMERGGFADALARIEAWLAHDPRSTTMVFALAQVNSAAGNSAATARAAEWRRSLWMDRHPGASPDTAFMPTIRALDALVPAASGNHRVAAAAYESLLKNPAIKWDWREELEIDCVRSWILAGDPTRALALIDASADPGHALRDDARERRERLLRRA